MTWLLQFVCVQSSSGEGICFDVNVSFYQVNSRFSKELLLSLGHSGFQVAHICAAAVSVSGCTSVCYYISCQYSSVIYPDPAGGL